MRPVPPIAYRQFGVFTTAQATASGWTMHALRNAVTHGDLDRLRPGAYALPMPRSGDAFKDAVRRRRRDAAAVSFTNAGLVVSHTSAGALHGLELVRAPESVCATFPRGRRGPMPGVHRHRGRLQPGEVVTSRGILLTSAARTVLDIGHELGADACIAAADSALRQGLTTRAALDAAMAVSACWPRIRPVHRAIALADPRAESALESISRLRMAVAGLPPPWPQAWIYTLDGVFLGRVDFYWDEFGLVGEADGQGKLAFGGLVAEKRRQGPMENHGLNFVRWGWSDLDNFDPVVAEILGGFARGILPDRRPRRWLAFAERQTGLAS